MMKNVFVVFNQCVLKKQELHTKNNIKLRWFMYEYTVCGYIIHIICGRLNGKCVTSSMKNNNMLQKVYIKFGIRINKFFLVVYYNTDNINDTELRL